MKAQVALALGVVLNATANILMKVSALRLKGAEGATPGFVQSYLEPAFLAGLVSFALALVAYRRALESISLSIAYPIMTSVGYLIVLGASWLFLREVLTPKQLVGCGLIVTGVWLVSA